MSVTPAGAGQVGRSGRAVIVSLRLRHVCVTVILTARTHLSKNLCNFNRRVIVTHLNKNDVS